MFLLPYSHHSKFSAASFSEGSGRCSIPQINQPHLSHFLIFFESGIFCSFLDVIFWGGSLDFIALLNWSVFDLKDVFLSVSIVFLLLFCMDYLRKYYRLGEEERTLLKKQHHFSRWIKSLRRTVK